VEPSTSSKRLFPICHRGANLLAGKHAEQRRKPPTTSKKEKGGEFQLGG